MPNEKSTKFISFMLVLMLALGHIVEAASTTQPAFTSAPVEKNGLQATVFGDKALFAKNEPIKFTVRFKNVSDKSVSLQDAGDFGQWIIRLEEVTSKMPWRLQGLSSGEPEPAHQPRELRPGESVEVSTDWGSNRFPFRYESELILNMPIPPADSLRPGRYRLWLGINLKRNAEHDGAHMAFRGDINLGPVEIEISDKDDPKGMLASETVHENNAEFQTVTRSEWPIPSVGAKSEVQLGLRVTNRGPTWMQINLFDTLQIVLTDAQGNEFRCIRERNKTSIPEPLILTSRESRTIYRNATLDWSQDGKNLRLSGSDGAGGDWRFDGLRPVRYTVRIVYENNDERLKSVLDRPAKHRVDPKEAPFWAGKVTTKEMTVEVAEAQSKAMPAADEKKVGTLESFKGWELYVWREGDSTLYSLLEGTNRDKGDDEIEKAAVKGVEAIKAKLDSLKAGQYVSVLGRSRGDRPPKDVADEVANYCKKNGLKAQ